MSAQRRLETGNKDWFRPPVYTALTEHLTSLPAIDTQCGADETETAPRLSGASCGCRGGSVHQGALTADAAYGEDAVEAGSIATGADAGDAIIELALGTDGSEAGLEAGIAATDGTTTAGEVDGSASGFLLQPENMTMAAKVTASGSEKLLDNRVFLRDCEFIASSLIPDGVRLVRS